MADEPFNELIVFSTPGIRVEEVSWLKADFSGDRNTYVPRPIQVISELITGIVTIADIAMYAGYMIAKGEIEVNDSRELIENILEWAEEFVTVHEKSDWETEDYIKAIDKFAKSNLLKEYGEEEY